ncbi:ABC transporter substrate-binding protein [Pradoshia eiseniae]|uniref:ABC transporter substrate-binding protein n=1 Tax=Pradoshia eiseniae TaxID=2064768 RepID=A0A2S7MXY4_9BACI|nr:EcsC family protein [Pradoshia eiseniae]PQD94630.1 ABC transporter substrate-binding protein [Pradoshia eiseniae]
MALTEREGIILQELKTWESEMRSDEPTDFEAYYDRLIESLFTLLPESVQEEFFAKLDNWLFHLHSMIHESQFQADARNRILTNARVFDEHVKDIEGLREMPIDRLTYIAEQQMARHRLYSLVQGGISAANGGWALASDLPAQMVINLRSIQLIGLSYGYDISTPYETTLSLKVFHAGTMPKRMQKYFWDDLMEDLEKPSDYFYEGEEMSNVFWFDQPIKQMLKVLAIYFFRKQMLKGVPIISLAIGSQANYRLTKNVTTFANQFYKYRYLRDKEGE